MFEIRIKEDNYLICKTDDIDLIIEYLDYIFIEHLAIGAILVNGEEFDVKQTKDYFILRNMFVSERVNRKNGSNSKRF